LFEKGGGGGAGVRFAKEVGGAVVGRMRGVL